MAPADPQCVRRADQGQRTGCIDDRWQAGPPLRMHPWPAAGDAARGRLLDADPSCLLDQLVDPEIEPEVILAVRRAPSELSPVRNWSERSSQTD